MTVWVLIGGYRVFADRETAIKKMEEDGWVMNIRRSSTFVAWFLMGNREVAVQSLPIEQ